MGRPLRVNVGGIVYHALNRGNGQATIFHCDEDYRTFEQVLDQAIERFPSVRLISYCLMPTHWHLILWPRQDGELTRFLQWLTLTHTQRWHAAHPEFGNGHLYQGRFKSFPVQEDDHVLRLCRYIERNPLRAGLVRKAENWLWSSLRRRQNGAETLSLPPVPWPVDWPELVQRTQAPAVEAAIRMCIQRGQPYGGPIWTKRTAARLGLASTLRPRGRPPKVRERST